MAPTIERADFADPRLAEFLRAHLADLEPTAPPGSRHALDLEALRAPGVRLWVAREGTEIVGTAALASLGRGTAPAHEELKSMRTAPAARGRGVATGLLAHLLHDARARGVVRLWLETGSSDFFAPARALYAGVGFVECPAFGSYAEDPHSVFMTLPLSARRGAAPATR